MVKTTLKGAKITALEETKIVLPTKRKEKTLDFWRGVGQGGERTSVDSQGHLSNASEREGGGDNYEKRLLNTNGRRLG